jgi:hypothetical protein
LFQNLRISDRFRGLCHPEGVGPRMATLRAEMKILRNEWAKKLAAKAVAAR